MEENQEGLLQASPTPNYERTDYETTNAPLPSIQTKSTAGKHLPGTNPVHIEGTEEYKIVKLHEAYIQYLLKRNPAEPLLTFEDWVKTQQ